MQEIITIPATLYAVSQFSASLEKLFANMPLDERVGIMLALQELLVNIVNHAYKGTVGDIQMHIEWVEDQLHIKILDHAPNMFAPPEKIEAPDPFDLPEGGMGLYIIYQSFHQVEYTRLPTGNHWQLSKSLKGA